MENKFPNIYNKTLPGIFGGMPTYSISDSLTAPTSHMLQHDLCHTDYSHRLILQVSGEKCIGEMPFGENSENTDALGRGHY